MKLGCRILLPQITKRDIPAGLICETKYKLLPKNLSLDKKYLEGLKKKQKKKTTHDDMVMLVSVLCPSCLRGLLSTYNIM